MNKPMMKREIDVRVNQEEQEIYITCSPRLESAVKALSVYGNLSQCGNMRYELQVLRLYDFEEVVNWIKGLDKNTEKIN